MLGRTANGLFWMFRYLERAENTESNECRIVRCAIAHEEPLSDRSPSVQLITAALTKA